MKPPTQPASAERGQVLVLVAGGLVVLILIAGLVLDAGIAFANKRDAQNVADISSVAGTAMLAEELKEPGTATGTDVYDEVETSVVANGCHADSGVPCQWEAWYVDGALTPLAEVTDAGGIPTNASGVRVFVSRQPDTYLIGMAGIFEWEVDAQATAVASFITESAPGGLLLPIALHHNVNELGEPVPYEFGQVYDLTDGKDNPGGFGWLSWTGSQASGVLAASVCTPNNDPFDLPHWVSVSTGKMNNPDMRGCLDDWIESGQTVLIPIYDLIDGTGSNAEYQIVAIASFVLTAREQPAVDQIQGYFVEMFPYTSVPGGATSAPGPLQKSVVFVGLVQ